MKKDMKLGKLWWWSLALFAGVALWLLLAGPERLFGWDTGMIGMALIAGCAWALLHAVSRIPAHALTASASPAEWNARVGAGVTLIAVLYFVSKLHVFNDADVVRNPGANAVVRNMVLLLIAWSVLSNVLSSRLKDAVAADERDRQIAVRAAKWGRESLIVGVVAVAVMLGLTPVDRLGWATPLMIGNLLVLVLMLGWLCEYAATLWCYAADRRAAQS